VENKKERDEIEKNNIMKNVLILIAQQPVLCFIWIIMNFSFVCLYVCVCVCLLICVGRPVGFARNEKLLCSAEMFFFPVVNSSQLISGPGRSKHSKHPTGGGTELRNFHSPECRERESGSKDYHIKHIIH
jgi:hypothetical protein